MGSVRQVVDQNASIVFARWYDPFGQIIKQNGGGDALYGYLGAQFDRISGLLYINGAYYDPVTGRFLSPVGDGQNPYVPLGGAALAPILILALLGRRKKGKIWTGWVVIALMMSVGLTLAACGDPNKDNQPPKTATPRPIRGITPTNPPTPVQTPSATTPPSAVPLPSPTSTCTPTPTSFTPQWLEGEYHITHYIFALESDPEYANDPKVSANGLPSDRKYRQGFLYGPAGILLQGTGLAEDGNYITIDWQNGGSQGNGIYFKYGIGGSSAPPVAWQTVAAGDPRLPAGTRVVIEVYPDKVFTVTDTGGSIGPRNIDIFVGAMTLAETYQLGTYTSRVAIVP